MKTILTAILSFYFIVFSYSQKSTICVYKVKKNKTLQVDSSAIKTEKVVKKFMNKALNSVDDLEYQLIYNNKESFFKLKKGLTKGTDEEARYIKMAELITSSGEYYQNLSEYLTLHQFSVYGEDFLINEPLNSDWEITNIKKIIGKYTCYKAINKCNTCGNSNITEVWYTPQIPIPFGPKGYGGLPGLIVEVKMKIVTLYLNSIFENQKASILRPKKGKPLTRNEYKKAVSKLRPTG